MMVSMISGCMMYTVLVANATTMIANTDPTAKEYKSKVLVGSLQYTGTTTHSVISCSESIVVVQQLTMKPTIAVLLADQWSVTLGLLGAMLRCSV